MDEWNPGDAAVPTTQAEAVLTRSASAKGKKLSVENELGCAAREIARFYAAHAAFPDQQLQAHMAGVCGASVPTFSVMVWSAPSDALSDTTNQTKWYADIGQQLGEWLPATSSQGGAAEISDGKTSVFAATVASSAVAWESRVTVVDSAGAVELSGSVRTPAAFVYGMINSGAHGVRDCQTDPRVAPPRFRLKCQLDESDASAWIDVQALPPGRVLSRSVGRLLARREGATLSFTAPTKEATPESVTSPAAFSQRLLTLVNEARKAAQLPALKLAARESETSARLAPHYFETEGQDDVTGDQIALGLLAGWDVQGTIRSGDFYSNMLSGSLDPKRWLGFMLDQPSARRVLLAPEARSIAIGPVVRPQAQSVGALINTYAFYETDDHRSDLETFVSELNEHRRGLGLPAAKVTTAPELAKAVRSVKTSHDPEAALQTAMQRVVDRSQRSVEGYYIEANDLDHVTFPEALLRPSVTIALSAAHHRYPDAAWGTLTVLVVVLESSSAPQTATVARRPRG